MNYPYPNQRSYAKEISRVFGVLSILFAMFLPPTGFLMGIIGLFYEKKSAHDHHSSYALTNIFLNSLGVAIGFLAVLYYLFFKFKIF